MVIATRHRDFETVQQSTNALPCRTLYLWTVTADVTDCCCSSPHSASLFVRSFALARISNRHVIAWLKEQCYCTLSQSQDLSRRCTLA